MLNLNNFVMLSLNFVYKCRPYDYDKTLFILSQKLPFNFFFHTTKTTKFQIRNCFCLSLTLFLFTIFRFVLYSLNNKTS